MNVPSWTLPFLTSSYNGLTAQIMVGEYSVHMLDAGLFLYRY